MMMMTLSDDVIGPIDAHASHKSSDPDSNGVSSNGVCDSATRDDMTSFWKEHSNEASEQEMMLDSNAEKLGKEEVPEILSLLPDIIGMDLLELGSGIGRFTGHLADRGAKSVLAVDFMENFVTKNKETNGHRNGCSFLQADVTQLELEPNSYDLVFSNWLLMYLSEMEVFTLFTKLLAWIRPGGYFFFRESCYHQSGNAARKHNPTQYRYPIVYNRLLQSISLEEPDGIYAFEIILSKSVQTYVKMKSNRNQICWLLHKVRRSEMDNGGYKTFQEFLDVDQYSARNIRCYEWIFGRNFMSPGGLETTEEFVKLLNLEPGQHVLDVGSGIGGSAFLMAQKYNVQVTGMDLSANMVEFALERANEFNDLRVQFEVGDATKRQYPPESFDVIYSRDVILHIRDKRQLFESFFRWLKPGGKLLITDYCCKQCDCGDDCWSPTFENYVRKRCYHLLPINEYAELLKEVGFVQVSSEDRSEQFINILSRELQRLEDVKDDFVKDLSVDDYDKFMKFWKIKLTNCESGELRWGVFSAEKYCS